MRMWMVDPTKMCRQHLLGEHVELHMFIGAMKKGYSMTGYLRKGLLEPAALFSRHEDLVAEMRRRGMQHNSPMWGDFAIVGLRLKADDLEVKIDREAAAAELRSRCLACKGMGL